MRVEQFKILEENLGLKLDSEAVSRFNLWEEMFVEFNSTTNLMSKNEVCNLFEKHLYDSLSVVQWKEFNKIKNGGKLLDIGTGGGFPGLILALAFLDLKVIANDSRSRKTKFLELIKDEMKLENLTVLTERAENISPLNVDIVTFRAVGKIKDTLPLATRHLKSNGHAVFYKAKEVKEELDEAFWEYKNLKHSEIVPYKLPLNVEHERNLVILSF